MQPGQTYIYDVGNKDALRLKILNDVYNPLSKNALLEIGIRDKKCVFDIACGQGEMTCWIAKNIQPDGLVVGVDISEDQLELARARAINEGLTNVCFIRKSLLDEDFNTIIQQFSCKPDFIYSRWLLIHLANDQVESAMQKLHDLLAPAGIMVHEEVTLKESYLDNVATSFRQYVLLFTKLADKLKINFDLGSDLAGLMANVGYQQIQTKISKPKFTPEQLIFFPLDVESAIPALEKFQMNNESEAKALIRSIQSDLSHGLDMTMANYIAYGFK